MTPLPSAPKRNEQVIAQTVDGTRVLLNLASGEYYTLDDGVGFRIWELCDGSHTVPQLISKIAEEYDASPENIEADVLELLEEFVNEELLLKDN